MPPGYHEAVPVVTVTVARTKENAMHLKHLVLVGLVPAIVGGCVASLRTRMEPDQARANIATVLKANGFDAVQTVEESGQWRLIAERKQDYSLTEKRYAIEPAPTMQTDPVNNNMTVFEEKVNPSKFTVSQRTEVISYRAEIRLPRSGPERAVTVSVTGSTIPVSNKYREITWTSEEPPSHLQVEEALKRGLAKVL